MMLPIAIDTTTRDTTATKEVIINHIKHIPADVKDIIKSYSFYTQKDAEVIRFIREKKMELCHTINRAPYSRYNDEINERTNDIIILPPHIVYSEVWVFGYDVSDNEQLQMQSINCIKCGNYCMNDINIPEKILCRCSFDELYDWFEVNGGGN